MTIDPALVARLRIPYITDDVAVVTTLLAQAADALEAGAREMETLTGATRRRSINCGSACAIRVQALTARLAAVERERDEVEEALAQQPNVAAELLQVVIERDDLQAEEARLVLLREADAAELVHVRECLRVRNAEVARLRAEIQQLKARLSRYVGEQ